MPPPPSWLRKGGHNTLHQDLYGEIFSGWCQILFQTSLIRIIYTGGEFVLTQQTPRFSQKPLCWKPKKGDMLIFTTNFRPVESTSRKYGNTWGKWTARWQRHTLGIIFHDDKLAPMIQHGEITAQLYEGKSLKIKFASVRGIKKLKIFYGPPCHVVGKREWKAKPGVFFLFQEATDNGYRPRALHERCITKMARWTYLSPMPEPIYCSMMEL